MPNKSDLSHHSENTPVTARFFLRCHSLHLHPLWITARWRCRTGGQREVWTHGCSTHLSHSLLPSLSILFSLILLHSAAVVSSTATRLGNLGVRSLYSNDLWNFTPFYSLFLCREYLLLAVEKSHHGLLRDEVQWWCLFMHFIACYRFGWMPVTFLGHWVYLLLFMKPSVLSLFGAEWLFWFPNNHYIRVWMWGYETTGYTITKTETSNG